MTLTFHRMSILHFSVEVTGCSYIFLAVWMMVKYAI